MNGFRINRLKINKKHEVHQQKNTNKRQAKSPVFKGSVRAGDQHNEPVEKVGFDIAFSIALVNF